MVLAASLAAAAVIVAPAVLPDQGQGARRGLEEQVAAWNRGDLEAALRTYWNSPEMTWVSKRGVERGFKDFAEAMRKDYGSSPSRMGTYQAEVLHAQDLGPNTALLVYKWNISKGDQKLMGAVSTQVWRRIDGAWRAVLEHAS